MSKGDNFQVVNISTPSNPMLMGAMYLTNPIASIVLSGTYAYVTMGYYGLQVIDISSPANPTRVGGLDTPVGAITLSGNHAYCSSSYGMKVIDISTPTSPVLVAGTPTAFIYASGVAVSGNRAYLGGFSGIQVIDISSTTNPVTIGSIPTQSYVWSVAQSGNYAYLADQYAGLHVINVSNPANPFRVGGYYDYSKPSFPFDLAVSGNHAYVLDYTNGLQVFSISNPAAPALLGACAFFTNTPRRLAVSGNTVYVTMDRGNHPNGVHYYAGLSIVDVSVPTNPVTVGTYWTTNPYAWWVQAGGVVVSNGYAYLTYGGERWDFEFGNTSVGDMQIINVSNPSNPVLAGAVGWPFLFLFESWDVAVSGGYAYGIIHYRARPPTYGEYGGIALLNVSNPNNPIWVGAAQDPAGFGVTFTTLQQHSQVELSGNHLWLLGGSPDLRVIDISNPTNMTLAASLGTGGKRIAVSGPLAYVASGYQGLQIYCRDCPLLTAELAGSQVMLKWPTNAVNFMVERAENVAAAQWQPQSGTPQVQDGYYFLAVPDTNAAAFFRLRGP